MSAKATPRVGRPPRTKAGAATEQLPVRLSLAELNAYREAAANSNATLSDFVRAACKQAMAARR